MEVFASILRCPVVNSDDRPLEVGRSGVQPALVSEDVDDRLDKRISALDREVDRTVTGADWVNWGMVLPDLEKRLVLLPPNLVFPW